MKKIFKKFLSSALAAVMTATCLSVGMVTTVMATEYTEYGNVTTTSSVKEWDFVNNMPTSAINLKVGDVINGITYDVASSSNSKLNVGYLTIQTGAQFSVPVPANSTGTVYVKATSGNAARTVSFVDGDETKSLIMNTGTTSNSATFTAAATSTGYIQFTAAGGECKIGLIQITLDEGFTFEGGSSSETTTESSTETTTEAATETTTEAATETTTTDTRQVVSVEPTVNDNVIVYNFVQTDGVEKKLISSEDDKSTSTAYSLYADNCYVVLDAAGAKLYDDSSDNSATLVIPYSASTGKVTVSGQVTPTNNVGSKWKLVDLGCVAVTADSAKNVTIASNNSVAADSHAGAITANKTITYSVTVDLDLGTASGTITNGDVTADISDVALSSNSISSISFVTNKNNSVSGGNDRGLLIPSVTITEAADDVVSTLTKTTAYTAPAVVVDGNNFYAIAVVESSKVATAVKVAFKTTKGIEIDSSDTVYGSVKIGETTYTASDLYDAATADDKVFATCITNDNGTDAATVLANVLTLAVDVQ